MDKILIQDLKVEATIGVNPWERKIKQRLLIQLELSIDCAPAAATDQLIHALDYQSVADHVMTWTQASDFQLLESLAEYLTQQIFQQFPVKKIKLRLMKPHIIAQVGSVGVEIERHANL